MAKANYDLPNDLIHEVQEASGATSKREAIVIALEEYLKKKKLQELIGLRGKIKLRWTQKSLRKYRDS